MTDDRREPRVGRRVGRRAGGRAGRRPTLGAGIGGVLLVLLATPATAQSVKAIFEKHKLIGTFAFDCSKPADRKNLYYVNRVLDENTIQRDRMSGPATRDSVIFIDKAEELRANELKLHGMEGEIPHDGIWRIEPNGMTLWQVSVKGKPAIQKGKIAGSNKRYPFLNRCGAP